MSKIKLTGHASGSGVLTIAAPNTDTDRTITLPDVTGTLLDSGSDLPAANLTGSVAAARIASNTIDSAHITAGAIDDAHLATGISASKLTGALPAISGAALTGLSASDSTKLPLAGGTMTGTIIGSGTSNTVGGASALRLGESNYRIMTGGEEHVLCLDRDNAGGTKKIMQSWNPDSGSVAIGNTTPVAAGMLAIKPTSITQSQLKLMGGNYSYGTELQSQNGSEGGTVGNTRQFFKIEHVTLGSTRTMYTTSSQVGTDTHKWETGNTTRLFMNNDGKLDHYGTNNQWGMQMFAGGTGTQYYIDFRLSNNTQVGYIKTNGSSTQYTTSSDYRLKENVDYTWDATTRLKQLKPARFNWIVDDTNTLVDGFLAHEVSGIVPEAVIGEKDATEMQGIDQSKLVPLLVKTIQELEARITALE